MKNVFNCKTAKNPIKNRPVKKWDVHGCILCPAIEFLSPNSKFHKCGMKNKYLDFMAVKKNVIPEWCPLEDY